MIHSYLSTDNRHIKNGTRHMRVKMIVLKINSRRCVDFFDTLLFSFDTFSCAATKFGTPYAVAVDETTLMNQHWFPHRPASRSGFYISSYVTISFPGFKTKGWSGLLFLGWQRRFPQNLCIHTGALFWNSVGSNSDSLSWENDWFQYFKWFWNEKIFKTFDPVIL